jgi:hypothetical protein
MRRASLHRWIAIAVVTGTLACAKVREEPDGAPADAPEEAPPPDRRDWAERPVEALERPPEAPAELPPEVPDASVDHAPDLLPDLRPEPPPEPPPACTPTVCPPPNGCCHDVCVPLETSDEHCGACDRACTGGTVCSEGRCASTDPCAACPGRCCGGRCCSRTCCTAACADLMWDCRNCGACGTVCGDPVGLLCGFGLARCLFGTCIPPSEP